MWLSGSFASILLQAASHWLREQTNFSRKLAAALCDLIPPALETVEDAEFRQFFEDLVASEAEAIDFCRDR